MHVSLVLSARLWAESTRDTCNYGQYINQFPQNTIKAIREFERIQKKICRHKMSIMFNEICINEEMLPKYTHIYIYIYIYIYIFTNPSARAGYDTRSIFRWSLSGLNSEFPSPRLVASPMPYYLPVAEGRIIGFIPYPGVLVLCEMQSVSSRI